MYTLVLVLHSWLRWGAILAGILAVLSLLASKPQGGGAGQADRWGLFFMIALDLQLLIGLLLYLFLSPVTTGMSFAAAMRQPTARFWFVEHGTLMFVAVALAHVGRVLARKASPEAGRRRLLVCFILALVAILAATPWPGTRVPRPLFRVSSQS